MLASGFLNAQVTVSGAVVGNGSYSTLSAAFTAINGGAQTSANIVISISASTSEPVTGAVLNAGTWSSIKIYPTNHVTVSAAVNPGLPLIDFNGADNVTVDGSGPFVFSSRGGTSLNFLNTTVSSTAGTSTIRFINDATNNLIKNCDIRGSSATDIDTDGGTVFFAGNAVSTGNDNNIIDGCSIYSIGVNLTTKGIYSKGTSSSTALNNSGDTIRNCYIYDYFSPASASAGIYFQSGTTDCTIMDCFFFQGAARTQTTGAQHSGIWINNASGNNFTIQNNHIGTDGALGLYTLSGTSGTKFYPVFVGADDITASNIQNNTIDKISFSGSISGIGDNSVFAGIYGAGGLLNIGTLSGNLIGNMSTTGNINISSSGNAGSDICGIYCSSVITALRSGSSMSVNISNNRIGGITVSNTSLATTVIYSVRSRVQTVFENNIIGGTADNSISNNTNAGSTRTYGLYCESPDASDITSNTFRNITAAGGAETGLQASVNGMTLLNSGPYTVSRNVIYNLKNTNTSSSSLINGIANGSSGSNLFSGNFVHTLIVSSNNSKINGILANGGSSNYQNNMIQLGLDTSGNSVTSGALIKGINDTAGSNNYYFNSVYIGGNPTSGSNNTFAFSSSVTGSTRDFRNNVFYNARSNSGSTGKHYSVTVGGTSANPPGLTINYNIYLANGTGSVFGLFNGSDVGNLTSWQTAVGQDANSFQSDPQFINPSGSSSSVDLHINPSLPTFVEATGINIVSVTDDYDGQMRSGLTPVDIGADAGNFIPGGPVNVSGALSGNGNYLTLSSAFTAINSNVQTSANIIVTILADISESVSGAVLNNGAWTSLKVQPYGGRTISANINPGSALIDLNGADNVTIDGLNTGGNSLTISNTSTSSTAGTSTLRFQTDATNNVITNCTILGSSTMNVTTGGGTIYFGGNSSSTGNDNNLVSYCNIGPAGANLPSMGINTIGTSNFNNSSDTIRNCNIYDYFNTSSSSSGIYISTSSAQWSIKDNKFYLTSPQTFSGSSQHSAVWINNSGGNNYLISGNSIGSASNTGTGQYTISGSGNAKFYPVYTTNSGGAGSSIQGNTIFNITMTGSTSGATSSTPFAAIYVNAGVANIGTTTGNTIGSMTDTSNISFTTSSINSTIVNGIYLKGSNNVSVINNNIGGLKASRGATGDVSLFCIYAVMSTITNLLTIQNNTIGGTVDNSIYNKLGIVNGIRNTFSGSIVTGNVIRNLVSDGTTGTGLNAAVSGISISVGTIQTVTQNSIYNLTGSGLASTVHGMYIDCSDTVYVSRNFVHTLTASSTSTINGIFAQDGICSYQNNMVQLGLVASGNSLDSGSAIFGINDNGGGNNYYFNSVYIGGSPTSGTNNTFAFRSSVGVNTRIFKNNIFYNARSNNGSSGKHYAVTVSGTTPNPTGLTIDNNIYLANGNGGVFGFFNSSDVANLAAWKTAVGQDANSYESNPQFINPNGSSTTVDLHINPSVPTAVESNGINIASITIDYDGQIRSSLTPVDIGADAGNFTKLNLTLNLTVFIQGLYDQGSNTIISDTLRVILRNGTTPYPIVDTAITYLNVNGGGVLEFDNASNNTPYYMQTKHRNALETWSDSARSFTNYSLTYNFTTAANKAYGDNMPQVNTSPVRFALYSGDPNQDGTVDVSDIIDTYNDALAGTSGYISTDENGDDFVDVSDIIIVYNNLINVVGVITP